MFFATPIKLLKCRLRPFSTTQLICCCGSRALQIALGLTLVADVASNPCIGNETVLVHVLYYALYSLNTLLPTVTAWRASNARFLSNPAMDEEWMTPVGDSVWFGLCFDFPSVLSCYWLGDSKAHKACATYA